MKRHRTHWRSHEPPRTGLEPDDKKQTTNRASTYIPVGKLPILTITQSPILFDTMVPFTSPQVSNYLKTNPLSYHLLSQILQLVSLFTSLHHKHSCRHPRLVHSHLYHHSHPYPGHWQRSIWSLPDFTSQNILQDISKPALVCRRGIIYAKFLHSLTVCLTILQQLFVSETIMFNFGMDDILSHFSAYLSHSYILGWGVGYIRFLLAPNEKKPFFLSIDVRDISVFWQEREAIS